MVGNARFKIAMGLTALGSLGLFARHATLKTKDRVDFFNHVARQPLKSDRSHHFVGHLKQQSAIFHDSVPPWRTADPRVIERAKQMNRVLPVLADQTEQPNTVTIAKLTPEIKQRIQADQQPLQVFVGGWSSAVSAYATASTQGGKHVLYVNNEGSHGTAIHYGAAYHAEFDQQTEGPLAINGYGPTHFFLSLMQRMIRPRLFCDADQPDYPWKTLNSRAIVSQPAQWKQAFLVAFYNECLRFRLNQCAEAKAEKIQFVRKEVRKSEQALIRIDRELKKITGQGIFRQGIEGSVYIAKSTQEQQSYQAMREQLKQEGKTFRSITPEEALKRFGIKADGVCYVKESDRIFSPQGLNTLIGGLTHHGAQYEAWQLTEIWVDNSEQQEHVVGFIDPKTNTAHYLKVQSLHLSLGATAFQPEQTPMCTATGVSYTAIVHGELRGGPIVCGASNHVVPLAEPVKIQGEYFTLIRGTCGASIGPRHLGKHSQAFLAQDAISLLKHTELSLGMEMDLIEVRGCHRVISGDNFAEIKALQHAGVTVDNIILSQGWGGGGLTTAGRVAADIFAAAPSRAELSPQTFKLSA